MANGPARTAGPGFLDGLFPVMTSTAFQDFSSSALLDSSAEETVDGLAALSRWRRATWWSGTR
ncbi:hypothetical protein [Streptomyces halstedii]|uniref:Uncharacterized protein n=1 Tax=Streptomyces halstedii TaxID=1944 RepID=A0A6N9TXH6_STRHA|nr:hypothetical protein [Streptomyces halstedii]NEA16191.1 hypothetical protein [Streptomyces halstedii]